MNFSLNNQIGSNLLKKRYKNSSDNFINISDLYGYLTVLITYIAENTGMDKNMCLYSSAGSEFEMINIRDIFVYLHNYSLYEKVQESYQKYKKNYANTNYNNNKFNEDEDIVENIIEGYYEDDSHENYDEDDEELFQNSPYQYLLQQKRKWNINNSQFNILNTINYYLLNKDNTAFNMIILPENIVEVEILYNHIPNYNEYTWEKDTQRIQTDYYYVEKNSKQYSDTNLKMGDMCETCNISSYESLVDYSKIPDYINDFKSTYDPIYHIIDRCLWDKFHGHYIIRSLNGITYSDLAEGIKMVMVSKFLYYEKFYGIQEIKITKSYLQNKFKLILVLNFYSSFL